MLGSVLQLVYAAVVASYDLESWADLSTSSRSRLLAGIPLQPPFRRRIAELIGAYRSGWGLSLILFGLHLAVTGWLMASSFLTSRDGLAGCSSLTVGLGSSTAFRSICTRMQICRFSKPSLQWS